MRDNRVRRMAGRQGYAVIKSRRRDPRARDYGGYWIRNPYTNTIVYPPNGDPARLDDIEAFLSGDDA